MLKVVITGSGGFVGSYLYSALKALNYDVIGLDIVRKTNVDEICDLKNITHIEQIIWNYQPNILIHTAKTAKSLDYCEENIEETYNNDYIPTFNIVKTIQKLKIKMIYISSDYVFDGQQGNYSDSSTPHPLCYYALSKLLGEEVVKTLDDYVILRPTVIYGWHLGGKNFFMQLWDNLKKNIPMKVPQDQISNPIFVNYFIKIIQLVIEKEIKGVYNATGNDSLSRDQFAFKICKKFNLDSHLILPVKTMDLNQKARRPLNCSTNSKKIQELIDYTIPSIDES